MIYGTLKSLFLVFNFWEAKNLLFLVFNVSGPSGTQIGKVKIAQLVFLRENGSGKKIEERRATRAKTGGPHVAKESSRVGPTNLGLGHRLVLDFLTRPPLARKPTP